MSFLGKILIISGAALIIFGLILTFGSKVPWLGRLPGDIYIQKKGVTFYFPLTTSILLSLIISLALFLLRRK
ncbi:MAG: DUF2905 domain-containing protein [Candidatus Omnitrophica bacterium]|nr:DUF2905 domain-containing protein [Candidatus Omnitrophota bacterium]